MKKLVFLLGIYFMVNNFVHAQGTNVPGGEVSGTWTKANSPYLIQGAIMIANDSTLTIEPGVEVIFQGSYKFLILGRLLAVGSASDTITFIAADTTTGWQGIQFDNTLATNDTSEITYCKLKYGKKSGAGGVIFLYNFSKVIISNNTISNNSTSANLSYGGGIYCNNSSPIISKNTISNNSASNNGGGIYGSIGPISNNILSNNNGSYGGGIYCNGDQLISNNTISNNSSVKGGALFFTGYSNPTLRNLILWGNTASISGNQVYIDTENCDPFFYYCDVQGGKSAFGLNYVFYLGTYTNNIDANPLFVSPSAGSGTGYDGLSANWSLKDSSICINAGDPLGTYPSTDKAGMPRLCDSIIDIGAYEFQKSPCNSTSIIAKEKNLTQNIILFPNPTSNVLNVQIANPNLSNIEVSLFNLLGQSLENIIVKQDGEKVVQSFDLSNYPEQVYLVRISTAHTENYYKIILVK